MKTLLATISLYLLILLIDGSYRPAYAFQLTHKPVVCGLYTDIQKDLIKNYNEKTEQIIGLSEQQQIVHVKLSSEKTYTIIEIHVSGMACILGAGELIVPDSAL